MEQILLYSAIIAYLMGFFYTAIVFFKELRIRKRIDSLITDSLTIFSTLVLTALWPIQITLTLMQRFYEKVTNGKTTLF